ncbi:uncharacterized protein NECHADRAFT_77520 [Fusarium vanettenii 77-13-4]|uniref:C3H1-type domain-containing protein n=1 Tax=Fusarium vanettenii (strain ATCC MYA-4622 / CBS 123669 / FGSC 9596 / NRRL 45880 / 77-13-4) TaxID=660122 RepID=C7YLG2_FUSV7|nr:uncharacterized protein NECHADRAFT_77520 [Fusarium vanettenii 77-13-4]EEU47255.1 hypothetical protein NECHADRAFT_77520 [Fusarium vanettenii 77-13-4]
MSSASSAPLQALLNCARDTRAQQPESSSSRLALDFLCTTLEGSAPLLDGLDSGTLSMLDNHYDTCRGAINSIVDIQNDYHRQMQTARDKLSRASIQLQSALQQTQLRRRDICHYGAGCRQFGCEYLHPDAPPCRNGATCRDQPCPFKHPNTAPCQFGGDCTTPGCTFGHPQAVKCRFGAGCKTPDCSFTHPEPPKCRHGAGCKSKNCKFSHPEAVDCRFGAGCKTPGCTFTHPDPIDCKFGQDCRRKDCKFAHPPPPSPPPYSKTPKEAEGGSPAPRGRHGRGESKGNLKGNSKEVSEEHSNENSKGSPKGNSNKRRPKSTVIPERQSRE